MNPLGKTMMSRSEFDVDLTKIVKREIAEYETPHGSVTDSYSEAVECFLGVEIQEYLRSARRGFANAVLTLSKEDRQRLRNVLDYLDRD